jgi:hypothetical protein
VKFIVVCRGDKEREEDPPAPYELATRTVFEVYERAVNYANGIARDREAIVVEGRFDQLRFDDFERFGASLGSMPSQKKTPTST